MHDRATDVTDLNRVTEQIIGAAIEVHKAIGPGLLESAYEECLCRELDLRGVPFERQAPLPVETPLCPLCLCGEFGVLSGWKRGSHTSVLTA